MPQARSLALLAFWLVAVAHVLYSPYTKVEESWTLHAVHDILHHGLSPDALLKVSRQGTPLQAALTALNYPV